MSETQKPFNHCRLEQEYIMAVVINRSGIDSGEVDYSIPCAKFDSLHEVTLEAAIKVLETLKNRCRERIAFLAKNCGMCLSGRDCQDHPRQGLDRRGT